MLLILTAVLIVVAFALWHRVVKLEDRLSPKLTLKFDPQDEGYVHHTKLGGIINTLFVRALPVCEGRVSGCVGYVTGVFKLAGGDWQKTAFDERLDLTWGNRGNANPIPVQKAVSQYLDIFCIPESDNKIRLCVWNNMIPTRAANVFQSSGIYRIDVGVMGDDNAIADISIKVKMGATWDKAQIEVLA